MATTYQEITWGEGGKGGTVTPMTESAFTAKYGTPEPSLPYISADEISYISIPSAPPSVPTKAPSAGAAPSAVPTAALSADAVALQTAVSSLSSKPALTQQTIKTSEGGKVILQKLTDTSYTKMTYGPDGHLVSSVTLNFPGVPVTTSILPSPTVPEAAGVPAAKTTATTPESAPITPPGYTPPTTPLSKAIEEMYGPGVTLPSTPTTTPTGAAKSPEMVLTVQSVPTSPVTSIGAPSVSVPTVPSEVTAKLTGQAPAVVKYVPKSGAAGELTPYQYQNLGEDQKAFWVGVDQYGKQVTPTEVIPSTAVPSTGYVPGEPIPSGKTTPSVSRPYPTTTEEEIEKLRQELSRINPFGDRNGENDRVIKYFPFAVPFIQQKVFDQKGLSDLILNYEGIRDGITTSDSYYNPETGTYEQGQVRAPFRELSYDKQKQLLENLLVQSVYNELPPAYALSLIYSLIDELPEGTNKQNLMLYVNNGDLVRDSESLTHGNIALKLVNKVKNPAGLATIGGALGIAGTIGALLAGGPVAALAASGTAVFSTTEFVNYYGMNPFRTKSELQGTGEYAPDHKMAFDQLYSSTANHIDSLGYDLKNMTPEDRINALNTAKSNLEALKSKLGDEYVYLKAVGAYEAERQRVETLEATLNNLTAQYTSEGEKRSTEVIAPASITIIPPKGGTVKATFEGKPASAGKDAPLHLSSKDSGVLSYKYYDSEGNLVGSSTYSYYPGKTAVIDLSSTISFETMKATGEPEVKKTVYTAIIPEGATGYLGGQILEGGKAYDIPVTEGEKRTLVIKKPGYKDDSYSMYAVDQAWVGYTPTLITDPYYTPPGYVATGTMKFETTPGSTVTVNGVELKDAVNGKEYKFEPGYYSVTVSRPGYEPFTKNVYIGKDDVTVVSDPATPERTYSYGGGGGGGGGGGYTSTARPDYGMIVYGPTCEGATIYQDDVQVYPELGKTYSISPGYHSIKVEKEGYTPWTKTVYAMAGSTLTISPAFEETTTKPEYTAYIIYGPTCEGAIIYQDDVAVSPVIGTSYSISPGYHGIRIEKEGYKPWIKTVYLMTGDTLTVSPAFEEAEVSPGGDGTVLPSETKRVYINSNPSSAKVLINGYYTGVWTPGYVDLPYGYYIITFTKSGYVDQNIALYVGDTILWGDSATARARSEGLI